uniref:Uncharacterized protein n=1 Tax=Populus trichocarpa TaxID=3694 RepID=A0A3N7FJC5_POPTR
MGLASTVTRSLYFYETKRGTAPVIWFGFGGFQLGMPLPSLGFDCSTSCCCAWVKLLSKLGQKIEVAFSAFPLA